MRINHRLQQEDGFTLIELMAVLAILTMLVLIAVPAIGSITKKAEAQADDATISMIEKAGGLALLGDVAYDDPEEEQYDVFTLVDEGYLDIDEAHKYAGSGNVVTRVKGYEFEFEAGSEPAEDDYPEPTEESLFTYEENATGVTITKYLGTDVDVVIPQEIDGKAVTEIYAYAFYSGTDTSKNPIKVTLKSVVIPDSVTSIGRYVFMSNQLTKVVIPDSVTSIGSYAFRDNQLTSVVIPDSVTTIGNSVFSTNQLTDIVIPDSVTSIGDYAFAHNQLTEVVIPDSVTSIGDWTFYSNQLTKVELHVNTRYTTLSFDNGVHVTPRN